MTPNRKATVNGIKVEQYYWAGEQVVYVDNLATEYNFDTAVKMLNDGISADEIWDWVPVKTNLY